MPYKSLTVTSANAIYQELVLQQSHLYKGFSSLNEDNPTAKLFDLDLIKQDILNHFNTRKGTRVMNPNFGSRIWDLLMEPLTAETRDVLVADIKAICTADSRVVPTQMDLTEYSNGYILELTLVLKATNESASMKIKFNQEIGIATV